jgi:hypothetical protein
MSLGTPIYPPIRNPDKERPMRPKIGDIVLFKQQLIDGPVNGSMIHPAIVTAVWSDTCVNLVVMFDSVGAVVKTSVVLGPLTGDAMAWNWRDEAKRALEGGVGFDEGFDRSALGDVRKGGSY